MSEEKSVKELLILDTESVEGLDFFQKKGFSRSAVARTAIAQYYQWYAWAAASTRPVTHTLPDGTPITTTQIGSAESVASVEA